MAKLYWNTMSKLLREVLETTMQQPEFDTFRLVGGTALSLQLGHRISVDLDFFTDAPYGEVNFTAIENSFRTIYPYVETKNWLPALGATYYVGRSAQEAVKVDIYYTDPFIRPNFEIDNIRLATTEEISAMKLEVVAGGGRKKDFWDIDELADFCKFRAMLTTCSDDIDH